MFTMTSRFKLLLATSALALSLVGCSSPANREAMTPQGIAISKHIPASLGVKTDGGSSTGAMDSSNVSDADLKAAIEAAVVQSKLFKSIIQGAGADYELSVRQISLAKPVFGATFTVEMETAWSLTKQSDGSVIMRKAIKSSGAATMGDALVAVTRLRMAVEAAARDNISQGLRAIAELNL
jgi:hypothetical protein